MNLAHSYARAISDRGNDKKFLDQVIHYMKSRGHASLLPQVVRILERTPGKEAAVVRVAKKEDAAKYKHGIQDALRIFGGSDDHRVEVDSNVVGGYMVYGNGKAIDKTFRTALVSLYQKISSV
jgi:F0F1-type ATP synthase delta subunit